MGARSVSKIHKGFAYVKLLNPTAADIEIKQNEPIARLHPCDEQDLSDTDTEEESIMTSRVHIVGVNTHSTDKNITHTQSVLSDAEYTDIAISMWVDFSV